MSGRAYRDDCIHGHLLDGRRKDHRGGIRRYCKTCHRLWAAKRREKARQT